MDQTKVQNTTETNPTQASVAQVPEKQRIVQRRKQGVSNLVQGKFSPNAQNDQGQKVRKEREFEHEIITMKRVTKVHSGGKRMRMSVFMVVGDKKGKLAISSGKGLDTKVAQEKALDQAKRKMITVNLKGRTIPHEITVKFGAAKIWMKPAAPGTGVIAGGPVRKVLEIAGVHDVLTKRLGCSNSVSNAYATLKALSMMQK